MNWLNIPELRTLLYKSNNFITNNISSQSYKFIVDKCQIGCVRKDMLQAISEYSNVFRLDHNEKTVILNEELKSPAEKTEAVNKICSEIREKGVLPFLKKWRNENYAIYSEDLLTYWFDMERSATGILGVVRRGVHVTGYTIKNGVYSIWIGKRSLNKETHPGKLDNMVGGGCNSNFSIYENVIKECQEEAGVNDELLKSLIPCGCISLMFEDYRGILPEIIYCYDLCLPNDFIPENKDGEVGEFLLMSVEEIGSLLGNSCFKYDSALVTLDFYFRHGFIQPDSCPDYYDLYQQLHQRISFE